MRASRLELMQDHVKVIYRSVTGHELPEPSADSERAPSLDEVERRFAELEAATRARPLLAERVAPFSFRPPLDVIGTERELVLELGVPGVERGDVAVELSDGELSIYGARANPRSADGQIYFHAEMAQGPFRRDVRLPEAVSGAPRVDVENGIVRIRLSRAARSPLPRA